MLLITESSANEKFGWDVFRLTDFYILFPAMLKTISPFPAELRPFKKILMDMPDAYELIPNSKRVLFELEEIQLTAMQNLIAKGLIDSERFKDGVVSRTELKIPNKIVSTIEADQKTKQEWFRFAVNELPLVEFLGRKGLKARSQLMEYRYDG
tara:strand:- start:5496 stop:5954 length:459 start_codon:yes stop_codon:yes gene_type:complete